MSAASVLAGELGLIGLFDLGQLLQLNGATGVLTVTREGRKGYLYFDGGQIVNAVDDEYHEGEGAAYRLFTWKAGSFEFRHEPPSGTRAIQESTEGLMLEAARRMDEAGLGEDGVSATERLQAHGGKFEALREVFVDMAREARGAGPSDRGGDGSPLSSLRAEGDALVYRPGHAPRLRTRGEWRTLEGPPLDSAAYEQAKARLLEGVWPPLGAAERTPQTRLARTESGFAAITVLPAPHDAVWVRPAALTPVPAERFEGPVDILLGLLAMRHGLLLVSGPDAPAADRLLHALVALLLQHRPATVLLVGDAGRWHHREEHGVMLRCAPAESRAWLESLAPEVAAFDTASTGHSHAALQLAPLVIASVVAPDAGTTLARWCARHEPPAAEAGEWLGAAALGVVHTPLGANGERLVFVAARVGAEAEPTAPGEPPLQAVPPAGPPAAHDPMRALAEELGRQLRRSA